MAGEGSARQVRVMVFAALLAPMAGLPALTAQGGRLGWLGPVLAIPFAVGGLALFRSLGPEGLGGRLAEGWGLLGRGVAAVYYLWAMALAALTAGGCVDRLGRTDYGEASPWLMSLALGAVAWYLTARGRGAFLRAAEIFYLALLAALVLFGVLGLWSVDWAELVPRAPGEAAGALRGLPPVLGTLSVGALGGFFPRESPKGKGLRAPVWWCLTAAGVCLVVTGTLGSALAGSLPLPFFLALQSVGLPGGFQRLEALGTAVWVLSDLTLFGMAALAGRAMTGDRAWGAWPVLAAGVLGGGAFPRAALGARADAVLWAQIALGAAVPFLLWVTTARRRRGATSCG